MPVRRGEGASDQPGGEDARRVVAVEGRGRQRRQAGDELDRGGGRRLPEQPRDRVDPVLGQRVLGQREVLGDAALAEGRHRERDQSTGRDQPAGEQADAA